MLSRKTRGSANTERWLAESYLLLICTKASQVNRAGEIIVMLTDFILLNIKILGFSMVSSWLVSYVMRMKLA